MRKQAMGNFLRAGLTTAALMLSATTQAVTIDFDDIELIPVDGCFCDHPLSNEYETKGLLINNGYLVDSETLSAPHALQGGDSLDLNFVGKLPTYVEMYVSAALEQVVYIDVFGESGQLYSRRTKGWAGEDDYTPYTDNQFVSLFAPEGITRISMFAYYNLRTSALIDNLRYEYDVPEPNSIGLMLLAIGGVLVRRRVKTKR